MVRSRFVLMFLSVLVTVSAVAAEIPLRNWAARPTWTAATASSHRLNPVTNANETTPNPMPFFPIAPCRVADTRGNGFTGAYGVPSLLASSIRNFTITGQCGIPANASAVSFNFTVANTKSSGDLRIYPAGGSLPVVSTLNWLASTFVIANAAIVPLSGGGAIAVMNDAVTTVDLIIDVNGYYYDSANGTSPMASNGTFAVVTHKAGDTAFFAHNQELTVANTLGAKIWTSSSGTGSAGVLGEALASSGVTYGVHGTNDSSTAQSAGVFGEEYVPGTDIAGVIGKIPSGSSGQSAGVRGYVGAGILNDNWSYAGVRGESDNFGTLGVSTSLGAGGFRVDGTGALQSGSYLGFSSTIGLHTIGTTSATGAKNFVEPHPTNPELVIKYASLEGNEVGTYFRGRSRFVGGAAVVMVPEDFKMVTEADGLSIQVTPIGDFANVAVVSIDIDRIMLKGSKDVEFFYTVNGVRHGYGQYQTVQTGTEFVPMSASQKMPTAYGSAMRQRLIQNGTFNEDGTVNMDTARRLGWTRNWEDRER